MISPYLSAFPNWEISNSAVIRVALATPGLQAQLLPGFESPGLINSSGRSLLDLQPRGRLRDPGGSFCCATLLGNGTCIYASPPSEFSVPQVHFRRSWRAHVQGAAGDEFALCGSGTLRKCVLRHQVVPSPSLSSILREHALPTKSFTLC